MYNSLPNVLSFARVLAFAEFVGFKPHHGVCEAKTTPSAAVVIVLRADTHLITLPER